MGSKAFSALSTSSTPRGTSAKTWSTTPKFLTLPQRVCFLSNEFHIITNHFGIKTKKAFEVKTSQAFCNSWWR